MTIREVTLMTGRGGYGKVGGLQIFGSSEGGVTDFFVWRGGGYRFFWECFKVKINVQGDLGQANSKKFRRFAPQDLKFVFQKHSEKERLKQENEEYMVDNEKEYMEEGRSSR